MAKFSQNIKPVRVLILDASNGTTVKTRFNYSACLSFFKSLGCHVEEANSHMLNVTSQVFRDDWDLICVPDIGNTTTDFPQLTITLSRFNKADIPVYISNVVDVANSGNTQAFTGVTAYNSTSQKITATGIENWEGRKPGNVTFYCRPGTAWDASVTPHLQDASGNLCMFSRYNGEHNVLMMVGYNSVTATIAKPWYGAQWMVDQCTDVTRKQEIKDQLRKRYILMRWDGLGRSADNTSYVAGHLDTAYNVLLNYGVKEIWLASLWQSGGSFANGPDYQYPEVANWFLARDKSNGGLFRCMNHETDIVNGISYNPDERCTTDGINPDGFKNADNAYRQHCDQLTNFGFELGSDGYGKGIPNVQDGNDMNNPAAHFLSGSNGVWDTDGFYGGFGINGLWINGDSGTDRYPTGLAVQSRIKHSISWAEGNTLLGYSQDNRDDSSPTEIPTLWNADIVRCAINGGGIYYHPGATFFLYQHADEFGQLFTTCPDILNSGPWEDMHKELKRGTNVWFAN